MSSAASVGSTISPFRTPRERDWPTPMMLRAAGGVTSPTTAHTLEVPTSRPTMTWDGSNIFLPGRGRCVGFGFGRRDRCSFEPERRYVVRNGKIGREDYPAGAAAEIVHSAPSPQL